MEFRTEISIARTIYNVGEFAYKTEMHKTFVLALFALLVDDSVQAIEALNNAGPRVRLAVESMQEFVLDIAIESASELTPRELDRSFGLTAFRVAAALATRGLAETLRRARLLEPSEEPQILNGFRNILDLARS